MRNDSKIDLMKRACVSYALEVKRAWGNGRSIVAISKEMTSDELAEIDVWLSAAKKSQDEEDAVVAAIIESLINLNRSKTNDNR